jgi:hypothetical protein
MPCSMFVGSELEQLQDNVDGSDYTKHGVQSYRARYSSNASRTTNISVHKGILQVPYGVFYVPQRLEPRPKQSSHHDGLQLLLRI